MGGPKWTLPFAHYQVSVIRKFVSTTSVEDKYSIGDTTLLLKIYFLSFFNLKCEKFEEIIRNLEKPKGEMVLTQYLLYQSQQKKNAEVVSFRSLNYCRNFRKP